MTSKEAFYDYSSSSTCDPVIAFINLPAESTEALEDGSDLSSLRSIVRMKIKFPENFFFGTSTSSEQIETAFDHDWQGVIARDGYVFDRTTDHEKQAEADAVIISSVATHYRMSLMWSKLQRQPYGQLDAETVAGYHKFLQTLRSKNVTIMMVIHHFVNPAWFSDSGGWENRRNVDVWIDFSKKLIHEFGEYVSYWNTFNEPNLYTTLGFMAGEFPPFKKNLPAAVRVIRNIARAHNAVYAHLKEKYPDRPVGISHNCAVFHAENLAGKIPARLADWWYMKYLPEHFTNSDFIGLSYYACVSFDPLPITNIYTPGKMKKLGKPHDDIWEYYPEGLGECIRRYWKKFGRPIIITENGFCSQDDSSRIRSIQDYAGIIHRILSEGIEVRGYFHWTTWDNFEWTLGPTYRFGLYECDLETMERKKKPSADIYSRLSFQKEIDVEIR